MITTKSKSLNFLLRTPLRMSAVATVVSLFLAFIINLLFLSPGNLPMTMFITLIIAAPMSYFTIKGVISLRMTIEEQKVKLALEHERANILSRFMRDAAHEFKTPLTLMSTNLYLAEKSVDQQKRQTYVANINEQIANLNTLLETILVLTRLDSTDKPGYQRQFLSISELISDVTSFSSTGRVIIQPSTINPSLVINVNLPDLHLALKEILGNALRFSPENSEINVKFEVVGQSLLTQIIDLGRGMNSETLQHIFNRFYRVDESHTTRGLGLGLSIAKQVIELNGGHIEIQSEIDKGTTVNIFLPIGRQS